MPPLQIRSRVAIDVNQAKGCSHLEPRSLIADEDSLGDIEQIGGHRPLLQFSAALTRDSVLSAVRPVLHPSLRSGLRSSGRRAVQLFPA